MAMSWENIIMETIVASLITGIFGVIVVLLTNAYINKRGYEKIDSKIGSLSNTTLSGQHDSLSREHDSLSKEHDRLERVVAEKSLSIYAKVDCIDKITAKNEALYQNLDQDQKEVRDNVTKLIYNWERTLKDNNELLSQMNLIRNEMASLSEKNRNLGDEITSLKEQNSNLIYENKELRETNKNLAESLEVIEEKKVDTRDDEWDLER